jgi:multidrug efflux system membrane fusion protein
MEEKAMTHRSGKVWLWLLLACVLVGGGFLLAPVIASRAAPKKEDPAGPRAVPVLVATSRTGDMKLYFTGLGSVTALNTVTIRSRVDGQLVRVAFSEGQQVQQGDLLAEIDPRPFQAQLDQAEGQLARDQALLKNAKIDLERDQIAKDAISAQQLATQAALVAQYEGVVKSDQGQVDMARLQVSYSRITAPLSGRIGLRLVDQGNMVHASDPGGLAVITQLQPISVVFTLPSDQLPAVMEKSSGGEKLVVEAYDRELKNRIAAGTLLAVDNQIDASTGTIRIKAAFPNTDSRLFPNQFVNARLLISERKGVVLIPTMAVQRGVQSATYVYVVKDTPSKADPSQTEKTVALQNITIGPSEGDDTVVEKGLSTGEVVVTDGVDKLQPGARVSLPSAKPAGGGKVKP